MPGSSDMRMGWVRMMPGDGLMESLVLVLVVGRGSEGSKLGVGEGTESSSTLEIRSASEGGVGVDRARGGSFYGDVNQLGQAVLHVGVVWEGRGVGVLCQAQGVVGGGEGEISVRRTKVTPGRKTILVSRPRC